MAGFPQGFYTGSFQHGLEVTTVPNPWNGQFSVGGAVAVNVPGVNSIERIKVRNINATTLGVTVFYAPPPGVLVLTRNADQTLTTGTDTPVLFDTIQSQTNQTSSQLTYTNGSGNIVCLQPGVIECSFQALYNPSANGYRQTNIRRPPYAGTEVWGDTFAQPYAAVSNYTTAVATCMVPIPSASTTIRMYAWQNTGGDLALSIAGGGGRNCLSVRYSSPSPTYSDTLTLSFIPIIP